MVNSCRTCDSCRKGEEQYCLNGTTLTYGSLEVVMPAHSSGAASSRATPSGTRTTNPVVSAPIVGASKPRHLADAAAALDITLTDEEIAALEEYYTPRNATGMSAADRPPAR